MLKDFEVKKGVFSSSLFFYYIKQINSMLSCFCSVTDHRRSQNVLRNISDTLSFFLHFDVICDLPKGLWVNSPFGFASWAIDLWSLTAKGLIVLVSPNQSDRKGNNEVSKCKLKKYLFGEKTKKNRQISLLNDYYQQSPGSVANQNAGFAVVHQLGDTIRIDLH